MIGLDTSAIIDLFKEDPSLMGLLKEMEDIVALNQISYLELMFGLDPENKKHKLEEEYYDALFNSYQVLPLDFFSCKEASKIFSRLKKAGKMIDPFDCTIAAIFLSNKVNTVITKNVKHFSNIPGLKVIKY